MNYRTDLAIERKEMLDEDGKMPNLTEGIIMKKIDYGDDNGYQNRNNRSHRRSQDGKTYG